MMNLIPGGGSRTILLSKRANIFYLDRVKVYVRDERVIYQIVTDKKLLDYNLPDCNTALVLLGKGSSITDAAIRSLAKSGVLVGFAGTSGSPLHAAVDYVFLNPLDEYRPTEYCQKWIEIWLDPKRKLAAAKSIQRNRIAHTRRLWLANPTLSAANIYIEQAVVDKLKSAIDLADCEQDILIAEAHWTKYLYAVLAKGLNISGFKRTSGQNIDSLNNFLDHGNYLLYGLSAVALHALGIPPAFPLLHGKTRRGGLVFDMADIYKDALVMPCAFEMTMKKSQDEQKVFRPMLIERCQREEVVDGIIKTIKEIMSL